MRLCQVFLLFCVLALAGCASGPPKRVFPPQVRVQELSVPAQGGWSLQLRVQNFSTVPITYDRIDLELRLDGRSVGKLALTPDLTVGPGSAEILDPSLSPSSEAATAIAARLKTGGAVRYQIIGSIHSADPRRDYPIDYESALNPAPGLTGVLR